MPNAETHLVIVEAAHETIPMETDWKVEKVKALPKVAYDIQDIGPVACIMINLR